MEPIRPEREESINPVNSKESRGTCNKSNGRGDGSPWSMNNVEHHGQEANLGKYLEV